jgi:hypothetical protein
VAISGSQAVRAAFERETCFAKLPTSGWAF